MTASSESLESIVYSINTDGSYTLNTRYKVGLGKVKWWTGPDVAGYTNIIPSGPQRYEEIGPILANLKRDDIKPFLAVRFDGDGKQQRAKYLSFKQVAYGTNTVTVFGLNVVIQDTARNNAAEYIPCGDITDSVTKIGSTMYGAKNREENVYLYAHKSIMQLFPVLTEFFNLSKPNILIAAPNADSELYVGIAEYYKLAERFPDVSYNALPAILRCLISFNNNRTYVAGRSNLMISKNKNGKAYSNTFGFLSDTDLSSFILTTVDDSVENMLSCILNKSGENAIGFQGLYVPEQKKVNGERALRFMNGFCGSDYNPIPKYANACACLGRAGVESALRRDLGNNLLRMVCQSSACLDGDRTSDVFTYIPTPPCAPINICKPGLDINAAKVTMSNVTFNCTFADGTSNSSSQKTPDPSSNSTTADTPSNSTTADTPSNSTVAPANSTTANSTTANSTPANSTTPPAESPAPPANNTNIIIGASVSVAVILIIVIVVVVIIKKRKRTNQ
jgi:hypothetical protein